jgi:hypothetical protein
LTAQFEWIGAHALVVAFVPSSINEGEPYARAPYQILVSPCQSKRRGERKHTGAQLPREPEDWRLAESATFHSHLYYFIPEMKTCELGIRDISVQNVVVKTREVGAER